MHVQNNKFYKFVHMRAFIFICVYVQSCKYYINKYQTRTNHTCRYIRICVYIRIYTNSKILYCI